MSVTIKGTIYLLGDAILDNFYWLTDKKDLRRELEGLQFNVNNYAVDETRVEDMINGIKPNHLYTSSRSYPYFTEIDGKLYQLKMLAQNRNGIFSSIYNEIGVRAIGLRSPLTGVQPDLPRGGIGQSSSLFGDTETREDMVILSIGGNNIKAKLMNIVFGIDSLMNAILTKKFIDDYDKLIATIKESCSRIVIVSVYLPYLGSESSYSMYANLAKPMMARWHEFLDKLARKHNVPIFDLNRTFDNQNKLHYDSTDIHASNLSNKCMAQCISYIYDNYDGYHTYYAPGCDITKIQII